MSFGGAGPHLSSLDPFVLFLRGGVPHLPSLDPSVPGGGRGFGVPICLQWTLWSRGGGLHPLPLDPSVPRGGSPSAPIGPLCPGGGGFPHLLTGPQVGGGGPFAGPRHPGWEGGGCGPPRLSGGKRGGGGVGGTSKELHFEAIHRGLRGGGGGTGVPSREHRERGGPYTRVVEWGWGRVLLCPGGYGPKGCRGGSPPGTMVMVLGGVRRGMSSGALRSANV